MLRPDSFSYSLDQLSGGKDVLLVGVKPIYKYVDGKRTDDVEGHRYEIILPAMQFERINVKVVGDNPTFTDASLREYEGAVYADITGFVGRFYRDRQSGEYRFAASAAAVTPRLPDVPEK